MQTVLNPTAIPTFQGAGLGLRRDHLAALENHVPNCIRFLK